MHDLKFEKMLKEQIQQMNEVPTSVEEKIQKAFQIIDAKEMKKQSTKWKWKQKVMAVTSTITVLFLAGNGVAFATGVPNIYSWILGKIGIEQAYEEVKTDVGQMAESNGVTIIVTDMAYDGNFLIIGYRMNAEGLSKRIYENGGYTEALTEYKDLIEKELGIEFEAKLKNEQKEITVNATMEGEPDMRICHFTNVVSDNEIIMYYVVDISGQKMEYINEIEIYATGISLSLLDAGVTMIEGEWKYSISNVNDQKSCFKTLATPTANVSFPFTEKFEEYGDGTGEPLIMLQNGEKAEIRISQVRTSKIGSIIKMETNIERGVMGSIMPWYAFEIVDSQGNVIKNKEKIANDMFFTKGLTENKSYTVRIYSYECKMYADAYNLNDIQNFEEVATFTIDLSV